MSFHKKKHVYKDRKDSVASRFTFADVISKITISKNASSEIIHKLNKFTGLQGVTIKHCDK